MQEAAEYATALKAVLPVNKEGYPVVDLVLLGLGADGHCGSNHPNSVAAINADKLAVAASPGDPSSITMTLETINAAKVRGWDGVSEGQDRRILTIPSLYQRWYYIRPLLPVLHSYFLYYFRSLLPLHVSQSVMFVVVGGKNGKKEAVIRALKRPAESPRGTFPAQGIFSPLFVLDEEAAAGLETGL